MAFCQENRAGIGRDGEQVPRSTSTPCSGAHESLSSQAGHVENFANSAEARASDAGG